MCGYKLYFSLYLVLPVPGSSRVSWVTVVSKKHVDTIGLENLGYEVFMVMLMLMLMPASVFFKMFQIFLPGTLGTHKLNLRTENMFYFQ